MAMPQFQNRSVVLLGAGVSNMPLAAYLKNLGASVTVRDQKTETELGESGEKLRALGVEIVGGKDYLDGIAAEYIFRSPGFRPDIPAITEAVQRGACLTSEMELFLENRPCTAIGITGSDGKTTTTTLVAKILSHALAEKDDRVFLGGNIGEPMLHRIDSMRESDFAVVELSSFQLMTVGNAPDVAVITNLSPNHLNWHRDMEEYVAAKAKILAGCGRAVLNFDNDITRELGKAAECPVTYFSHEPIPDSALRSCDSAVYEREGEIVFRLYGEEEPFPILLTKEILLPGRHNVENYMAAIAAVRGYADPDSIAHIARTFGGVAHRLQRVHESGGVTYYNSSIDSSPSRTAAALSAMAGRSLVLIAGGYDKNIPYAPLAEAVLAHGRIHTVVLTGATADKIETALLEHPAFENAGIRLIKETDFETAVRAASAAARVGDAVLLSPASASFDAFKNFEERGECFSEIVRRMAP